MRRDEQVEPAHAGLAQALEDRAVGRAGVDEDGGAAVLDERRVALADVEERDREVARRLRRARRERDARRSRRPRARARTRSAAARRAGVGAAAGRAARRAAIRRQASAAAPAATYVATTPPRPGEPISSSANGSAAARSASHVR